MSSARSMKPAQYVLGVMFLGAFGLQITHKEFFDRLVPAYLER